MVFFILISVVGGIYLLLNFFYRSKAESQAKVKVDFLSNSVNFDVNQSQEISLNLLTEPTHRISGVELVFTFDNDNLDLIDFEDVSTIPSNYFDDLILVETKRVNETKKLKIVLFAKKNYQQLSNLIRINLKFKSKNNSGTGKIIFLSSESQIVGSNVYHYYDIEPETNTVDYQTRSDRDIKINFKLRFQGIVTLPRAKETMNVSAKIVDESTGRESESKRMVVNADNQSYWRGTIYFPEMVPASNYAFYLRGEKHLLKKICHSSPVESTPGTYSCNQGLISLYQGENNLDFSQIMLLAGDLPEQDGVINSYDTSLIRNNLGKNNPDILEKADINLDGIINSQDYALVIYSLSVVSQNR